MQLYQNPDRPDHAENNAAFLRVVKDFPSLEIIQPSPQKAPWHFQTIIAFGQYPIIINFWPHTLKAQRDGFKSVQGADAIRGVIEGALDDALEQPFDLIERG